MNTPSTSPRFVVNVEVALRKSDSWLLIERGKTLPNAPGLLAFPGGKVEATQQPSEAILEETARRELDEEIGINLAGVALHYAHSIFFMSDRGSPVIGVVFAAEFPAGQQPRIASPREVESIAWWRQDELTKNESCPPWTIRNLGYAATVLP